MWATIDNHANEVHSVYPGMQTTTTSAACVLSSETSDRMGHNRQRHTHRYVRVCVAFFFAHYSMRSSISPTHVEGSTRLPCKATTRTTASESPPPMHQPQFHSSQAVPFVRFAPTTTPIGPDLWSVWIQSFVSKAVHLLVGSVRTQWLVCTTTTLSATPP